MSEERFPTLFVDRSSWEPGPWDGELDRYEWKSEHGLPCLMVRQKTSGHWCGYVGVKPEHPWHGKSWDDISPEVHGGITYGEHCGGNVCHVPEPGEPEDLWWVGFDCKHAWDESPGDAALNRKYGWSPDYDKHYKAVPFVRSECESLAKQAAEAACP